MIDTRWTHSSLSLHDKFCCGLKIWSEMIYPLPPFPRLYLFITSSLDSDVNEQHLGICCLDTCFVFTGGKKKKTKCSSCCVIYILRYSGILDRWSIVPQYLNSKSKTSASKFLHDKNTFSVTVILILANYIVRSVRELGRSLHWAWTFRRGQTFRARLITLDVVNFTGGGDRETRLRPGHTNQHQTQFCGRLNFLGKHWLWVQPSGINRALIV